MSDRSRMATLAAVVTLYLVGLGGTWGALARWYPPEDCDQVGQVTEGMSAMEMEGRRVVTGRCGQRNRSRSLGRILGSLAWPVVLPVQLGVRIPVE